MKKVLLVCSGGGHLSELLEVSSAFDGMRKILVTYAGEKNIAAGTCDAQYTVPSLVRLRTAAASLWSAIGILWRERPDAIISSGSELALPFFYIGKAFGARLIFLESCAQVYTPSLTGRLVYPVTDLFLVQWESLKKRFYRKARYAGGLI